jgi:transposase-like protein
VKRKRTKFYQSLCRSAQRVSTNILARFDQRLTGEPWTGRAWNEVVPFFAYPSQIRKMIYNSNAIESLHRGLRKIIKTRGAFPSDDAATKLLYLALRNLGVHWKPAIEWRAAYAQLPSSSLTACQLQSADVHPPWIAHTQVIGHSPKSAL